MSKMILLLSLIVGNVAFADNGIKARIDQAIHDRIFYLEAFYRDLHMNPELSNQESTTATKLANDVRSYGFEVTENVGGHGIVAIMRNGPGPTILIRTDLDALPLPEETGLPYASQVPGVMHACGHDIHMTVFNGTAYTLSQMRDQWSGTLMMIGQPAEEIVSGANQMLADGLYKRFGKPDIAIALHDVAFLPAGAVGFINGDAYATNDSFNVTFYGQGAHGSTPFLAIDPLDMFVEFKGMIDRLAGRYTDARKPKVIGVGKITYGTKRNIIPNFLKAEGLIRTFDAKLSEQIKQAIQDYAKGIAETMNAPQAPTVEFLEHIDKVYNDPNLMQNLTAVFRDQLGVQNVYPYQQIMGSEDFGAFGVAAGIPSVMFILGTASAEKWQAVQPLPIEQWASILPSNHMTKFAPDYVNTLPTGIQAMTRAALYLLPKAPSSQIQ